MSDRYALSMIAIAASLASAGPAFGQDETSGQGKSAAENDGDSLAQYEIASASAGTDADSTIMVTSSRIASGDPSIKVTVITAEEIRARGVTSVEELVRTLPQNVATIGAITNERARGPLQNNNAPVSELGSLGVSAANLGGVGAGSTLVLVNGRRIAGAAGIQDGFVNLNNIPLSAVERVEISTSGASAIYGADALGGVINFILKSNYSGTTITAQHEFSKNGADNSRISLYSRQGWSSGNISGTVSYSRRDPVSNYKSGYVTRDYSDYFNGNPAYDYRSFASGVQPAVFPIFDSVYDPDTGFFYTIENGLTVPKGFTGRPTLDDLIQVGPDDRRDFVPEFAGPKSETVTATLNFEQHITDKFRVFATGLFSYSENEQDRVLESGLALPLAPGQYYNPFPAFYASPYQWSTSVYYYPEAEVADGLIPAGHISNKQTAWSVNGGFSYDFSTTTRLEFVHTRSRSKTDAYSDNFQSLVFFREDPTAPSGYSCYNFQLANNIFPEDQRDYLQAKFDAQCAALSSSDPNIAFNPWQSTADGTGGSIDPFFYQLDQESRGSEIKTYELRLNGELFNLPGGPFSYAVGAEYADDGVDSREVNNRTGFAQSRDRYAFFGEIQLPLVSRDANVPLVRRLVVTAAARNDNYVTEGAIGTVDGIPYDQGGEVIYAENTFSRTTPSFGLLWSPFDTLDLRAHWSTGFRAPPFTQLFNVSGGTTYETNITNDPIYDCQANNDCDFDYGPDYFGYYVPQSTAPNPDLRPETSQSLTLGATWRPDGALNGLQLSVTYDKTKIDNQYANSNQLGGFLPYSEILKIAEFYPRDANGRITSAQNLTFNILGSRYESITYEASYVFETSIGRFEPMVTYLDNLKAETQAFEDVAPISSLGKLQGPDEHRIVGSLGWSKGDVRAMLWVYNIPSYINDYELETYAGTINNPAYAKRVDGFTTVDLTASWDINSKLRLDVAARDLFAVKPPFAVVQGRPYDTGRYNAAGRRVSVQIAYSF